MEGDSRRACFSSFHNDKCCGLSRFGAPGVVPKSQLLVLTAIFLFFELPCPSEAKECDKPCLNGQCSPASGSCLCDPGWVGEQCQHCGGRFRLTGPSGFLTDGPGNYKYKTKCTWLIEGQPNTVLRLRFNHFATECSWDHLYVYDGDSIYAPLLAAFSGLIVPEHDANEMVPEVASQSGYTLLHFFSDAAYNLTGFNISYRINSCPSSCSGHGECRLSSPGGAVRCSCAQGWRGEACNSPYCVSDCGFPERGICEPSGTRGCVCHQGWQGPDCSTPVPANCSFWTRDEYPMHGLARTSHKAVVHDNIMWVIGGYMFNHSDYHIVKAYNLSSQRWLPLNRLASAITGRYGHSLALHEHKIYMYGGKNDLTGNISSQLWVFHVQNQSWALVSPRAKEQYAVVGHSAHVVQLARDISVMLVIFGHCPLYGYISKVQEYNIGETDKTTPLSSSTENVWKLSPPSGFWASTSLRTSPGHPTPRP